MECIREKSAPDCKVACQGIIADVTKRQFFFFKFKHEPQFVFPREVTDEKGQQSNKEKLIAMRDEYEKYKELWGLNLHYSHSAGAARNYSKLHV